MERIPALLWVTDSELQFTSLTGTGLQATNLNAKDYAGKLVEELFPRSESGRSALKAHRNALKGYGSSFDLEVQGRSLEAHVTPLRGVGGAIEGVIGIALDVTERLLAQRALQLSEQSYRLLFEEAPYAICRATESGQLLQVNPAMLDMLGYDPGCGADLLVCDLPMVFTAPEGFERFREGLLNVGSIQGFESTWSRRDGQQIQVRIGGNVVRDTAGGVLCLDLLAENITERKRLEARLNQAEKMQAVGQLAGGVAHDFNNLLTVIGGQVEVVLEDTLDEALKRRLEDVKRAADRAATLTRQLLAFSRRQVLHSKVVDLNELIEHLCRLLRRLLRENVELSFVAGRDLGCVKADPNQIEQVLINLAVNAQDAMPQGGRLTLETANVPINAVPANEAGAVEPGEYVVIHVADTGHGMDRETQAHIFEPFFTTKKVGEGTGLGLSMAYGVVRQSGGYIQVESQPGEGSIFKIYLPRVAAPEPAIQPIAATSAPRGRETILFAEDEEGVRRLMMTHLTSLGYHVISATDGLTAIEAARAYPGTIDLLLSDFIMPRMGGQELAQELRRTAPNLKTIFISGYFGRDVAENEDELPRTYFVEQPISMQRLATVVREVLDGTHGSSTGKSTLG